MHNLEDAGEQDELLLLVRLGELLAVRALLALGPLGHLGSADDNEDGNGPAAAGDDDADPRENLKHVVGAGDEGEAVAAGDLALGAAAGAQAGEVEVDNGVGGLAKEEDDCADNVDGVVAGEGGGRGGRVDVPGAEEAGKGPVEEGVLEDVAEGHGVGGELVHEEGLVLALEEVAEKHGEGEELGRREGLLGTGARVDVGAQADDGDVDEDGSKVLDHEDGAPCQLGSCAKKGVSSDVSSISWQNHHVWNWALDRNVPRSLTNTWPAEITASSLLICALRFFKVFWVEGSKRPTRLKSLNPAWRAMRCLTSSTVASAGTSIDSGSFLIGCFGAVGTGVSNFSRDVQGRVCLAMNHLQRLLSLSVILAAMASDCPE